MGKCWGLFRRARLWVLGPGLLLAAATGCAPVELSALVPASGPPGTVVEIQGTNLSFASVLWDAGTGSERELDSSFLSARFFTVPSGASTGLHAVQLESDGTRSSTTLDFNVTEGTVRPAPRIDDITVFGYQNVGSLASMILMVHGANFDVGATIEVFRIPQATEFSRLLRNNTMHAMDPSTLGYPIFHYATLWAFVVGFTPGSFITVEVVNEDGMRSNSLGYQVPLNAATLDSDGDGLLDDWERNGYDAEGDGVVDVDLPALGANPFRKDLFVEVDWMDVATPDNAIWANIEDTFADAPILNTDGSQGITIHIDRGAGTGGGGGDTVSYAEFIRFDDETPLSGRTYTNFFTVKSNNFDSNREDIFRYCVFAYDNGHSTGSSGRADDIPARDFFVTLHNWGADGEREDFQTGTFLHELGHALNLRHGGDENTNSKDNYNSVMQYGNGWIKDMGQDNVYGPSQMGGIDTDCDIDNVDGVYTFSQGQRADLDETDLDEDAGICDGVDRDWDSDGTIETSLRRNIDSDSTLGIVSDSADWANVMLPLP